MICSSEKNIYCISQVLFTFRLELRINLNKEMFLETKWGKIRLNVNLIEHKLRDSIMPIAKGYPQSFQMQSLEVAFTAINLV